VAEDGVRIAPLAGIERSARIVDDAPVRDTGAAGFVTSMSLKSPRPCRSRKPLGEPASSYSLAGTDA
jgi:hypothetical protein